MGEHKRNTGARRLSVTVVIPTIPGREALLELAMRSVQAQRRPADVVIVEMDGHRTGAAATRNRALAAVETDVIAWLDDDDELLPAHLITLMRVLEAQPDTGLVYPIPVMVGGRDLTATTHQGAWTLPWGLRWDAEQEAHLRRWGSMIPVTHLVRTDLVRAIGGFRQGYQVGDRYRGEDEDYLIRLLDAGVRFEHLPRKTWRWHMHSQHTVGRGHGQS